MYTYLAVSSPAKSSSSSSAVHLPAGRERDRCERGDGRRAFDGRGRVAGRRVPTRSAGVAIERASARAHGTEHGGKHRRDVYNFEKFIFRRRLNVSLKI